MFSVSDDEYLEFKRRIRSQAEEIAKTLGRSGTSTSMQLVKEFRLLFLDFMEHGDRAIGIMIGVALEEASKELFLNYLVKETGSVGRRTRRTT